MYMILDHRILPFEISEEVGSNVEILAFKSEKNAFCPTEGKFPKTFPKITKKSPN